jgi:hypothetical protein
MDPDTSLEAAWLYKPGAAAGDGVWSRIGISGTPYSARIGAALAFDPIRNRIVRCTGKDHAVLFGYSPEIDTWDWAGSTWKRTDYSDDLPYAARRAAIAAAFDLNRDVLVLYGGINEADLNGTSTTTEWIDTWEQRVLDVVYVNAANSGAQDGSAAHPYRTLRQALARTNS